jgi:hypothetical protein
MLSFELAATEIWQRRELTRTAPGRIALRALMVLWRAEGPRSIFSMRMPAISIWWR